MASLPGGTTAISAEDAVDANVYNVHFVLGPISSDRSKVCTRKLDGQSKLNTRSSRRSRNGGKLSQLMDMPMDIFLEVVALLHPRDLLCLARVSRHFRTILMSRSSKGMWAAARKNSQDIPSPPDTLSEPKYASVLFERDCQACGVPRAGKESFALSIRLCSACWKVNVLPRRKLLQNHQELKSDPDGIFPLFFSLMDKFYEPEVQVISTCYFALSGTKRDHYVEQRRAYIRTMKEHERAVLAWQHRARRERNLDEVFISTKRKASVIARLVEMGYSEEDLPSKESYNLEWQSLVWQPRELTEQIWKRILPKLEECISREARRREVARLGQRTKEAELLLEVCLHELWPTCEKVLTTYAALRGSDEICGVINNDTSVSVTREAIEAVLPSVIKRQTDTNYALYLEAFQRALGPQIPEDDVKPQPLQPDLNSAIALFPCLFCNGQGLDTSYTLGELSQHIRDNHSKRNMFWRDEKGPESIRLHVDTVGLVLKMLRLPQDTAYDDVCGKVVCLCGKPGFEQPTQFSSLIRHIEEEHHYYNREKDFRQSIPDADMGEIYDDHDLNASTPFLKLLQDDESFDPPEVTVPEDFPPLEYWGARCNSCVDSRRFHRAKNLVWHIQSKHRATPTGQFVSSRRWV